MKVFIVERGEKYEGDGIIGVFALLEKATTFAKSQPVYGPYEHDFGDHWKDNTTAETCDLSLVCGNKYVTVTAYQVE